MSEDTAGENIIAYNCPKCGAKTWCDSKAPYECSQGCDKVKPKPKPGSKKDTKEAEAVQEPVVNDNAPTETTTDETNGDAQAAE